MLWQSTTLIGSSIEARDGAIGSIADLLFDETDWTVRWVVVDTGTWLPGRKVLLPPGCLGPPATNSGAVHTELTRQQVQDSPDIDSDAPVSRQSESSLFTHYGWAPYWYPAPGVPAMNMVPMGGIPPFAPLGPRWGALPAQGQPDDVQVPEGDPTLRSMNEVTGYDVAATDDHIGHVEYFMVEDGTGAVRYIVVDTRNWWPGRKVLVSTKWFRDVSWKDQQIHVELTRAEVEQSPAYDPSAAPDRAEEESLFRHYAREPYWL